MSTTDDRRLEFSLGSPTTALYRNHRGETETRRFTPIGVWYGKTNQYAATQWFLMGFDLDLEARRDYALDNFMIDAPKEGLPP